MGLFTKKQQEPMPFEAPPVFSAEPEQSGHPPVEQVLSLQQQGLTSNQIVEALQRQGYTTTSVLDALNQAEAKRGVEHIPPPEDYSYAQQNNDAGFEQIAESIVNERWQQFSKEMTRLSEWKEHTDSRVDKLEQSVLDMKNAVESLHKALVAKISDYDRNLLDVGTEIKAMERVFQKLLPTLSENVSELSRITKNIKGNE